MCTWIVSSLLHLHIGEYINLSLLILSSCAGVNGVFRDNNAMNLVAFSIKTKGLQNFARRLRTVFTRFGFSEKKTRKALYTIIQSLQAYHAAPTFFIPAVVLRRHADLISEIVDSGAEVGVHGFVHNDFRYLSRQEQDAQTHQAMSVFQEARIPFQGFRNPYLGWNEDALRVFVGCGFSYESNLAVLHEVIDPESLSPLLRGGYEKSLALFQATPCTTYAQRPHFEGSLLRIPISIPDDEMLFDRLRITDPQKVGRICSEIMQRVYACGGLYTLNLHPERGVLCRRALEILLATARSFALPVWITRLEDIAQWWKERSKFAWNIRSLSAGRWQVDASCTPRAVLLARHLHVAEAEIESWVGGECRVKAHRFTVQSAVFPGLGVSSHTPQEVIDFLREQGYPTMMCAPEDVPAFALYIDMPEGLGGSRQEQMQKCSELVERVEKLDAPLLRFGCWPDGNCAALSISGDIDSVTIQDFFLRILEVRV